jgi:hypothetical protein
MNSPLSPCTAFDGPRRIASGPLGEVALAVKTAIEGGAAGPVLIFDDTSGRVVDVDIRGGDEDVQARLTVAQGGGDTDAAPRGRGRPKLGVVAREITLLPRQWDWLSVQPGGASVALRRLVDEARRASGETDRRRNSRESAYRFMAAMAGDLPHFEEATRALFADDAARLASLVSAWPEDMREHVLKLAGPASEQPAGSG